MPKSNNNEQSVTDENKSSKENTEKISQFLGNIGISESKFADLWSQNLVELVGSSIPILATVLCWNTKDTKKFSEMVGMMGITSIYAGNPIGLIVTLSL